MDTKETTANTEDAGKTPFRWDLAHRNDLVSRTC